jgi:hypothetical protein
MHSLAETFRWQVEYRGHRQVPGVRLATTDAEVQIRLHRQGGEEVLCLGAAHEWVTVTDSGPQVLPAVGGVRRQVGKRNEDPWENRPKSVRCTGWGEGSSS